VLLQGFPGHIEKIGDAGVFQRLERDRAGVEQRGEAGHRRRHMRMMPSVQANAAMTLARPPRDRPAANV